MQTRFRWLHIAPFTKASVAKLAAELQRRSYARDVTSGFNLETVRTDSIEGTFTQRKEFDETVEDPMGGVIKVHRVAFDQCSFAVGTRRPILRISNPAKFGRALVEVIANALDYTVAITPIEVDPLEWVKALAKRVDRVSVGALRTLPFEVTNEIAGVVRLNGQGHIVKELRSLLGKTKVGVSNIACTLRQGSTDWKVELRASGIAVIHAENSEVIAALVGEALISASETK